ncbi:MAG: serine/threonine protein phosphatase [Desulfobacterales bacterium]|nr:serine/threonine protein phosphatase [Desulfobacterales bacterium]
MIGDVHGCLETLKRLMDEIAWMPGKDRLYFLGDYIDRGNNSKGVVDYILELISYSPHVECLLGNHEAMFLDFLQGKYQELFLQNFGKKTIESYQSEKQHVNDPLVSPDHMAFFQSLKPFIELEDYYLVHAGFKPGTHINKQSEEDMLWIREPFISSGYDFGKMVIFGHTPFHEPIVMQNKIGLDTGAVYGNRLTCLELPEMRFYMVEAEEP